MASDPSIAVTPHEYRFRPGGLLQWWMKWGIPATFLVCITAVVIDLATGNGGRFDVHALHHDVPIFAAFSMYSLS